MAKTRSDVGEASLINPKGFYLRSHFTRQLLAAQFK
jgi:DNA mismatch repair protein MutH